jgi:hypothetical protein
MGRFTALVTEQRTHPHSIRLLRKAIYLWFLVNTLILLPSAPQFWGQDSFIPNIDPEVVYANPLINILSLEGMDRYYPVFLILQIILLVLGILCVYPRAISILIYLVSINLDNRAFVILDGGNNLMHLMLIYLIFMNPSPPAQAASSIGFWKSLDNGFSNAAFLMARLQVVIVYMVSGLGKVAGELWQNGTALYYTLNVDEYTHPIARDIVTQYPVLTVTGTYVTLLYQVAFPWLVWNRKIRPYLLSLGTLIHLQISFVMGLFMFGFAIAVAYLSFTTDHVAEKILKKIDGFFSWIVQKLRQLIAIPARRQEIEMKEAGIAIKNDE